MSLISGGVDVDRLKEPDKRRQMINQISDEEDREDSEPEDMIEAIVKRFLTEQTSLEENMLKIEIVERSQSSNGENEQKSKYMMIAKLQIGQDN